MSQVSRRILAKKVQEKMFQLFFNSLARLTDPKDVQLFLFDFLSPPEQTMLAKRFAIAILLEKGYQYEAIKDILKVSQETIARVNMSLRYKKAGYKKIVKKALQDEKIQEFFEKAEDIVIALLPRSSVKKTFEKQRNVAKKSKTVLG